MAELAIMGAVLALASGAFVFGALTQRLYIFLIGAVLFLLVGMIVLGEGVDRITSIDVNIIDENNFIETALIGRVVASEDTSVLALGYTAIGLGLIGLFMGMVSILKESSIWDRWT